MVQDGSTPRKSKMVQGDPRWFKMVPDGPSSVLILPQDKFSTKKGFCIWSASQWDHLTFPINSEWWNESRRPHYSAEQIDGHKDDNLRLLIDCMRIHNEDDKSRVLIHFVRNSHLWGWLCFGIEPSTDFPFLAEKWRLILFNFRFR